MQTFITVRMTRIGLLQQIKTQNLQVLEISQVVILEQYLMTAKEH